MRLCYSFLVWCLLGARSRNAMRTADMYEADTMLSCALVHVIVSKGSTRETRMKTSEMGR